MINHIELNLFKVNPMRTTTENISTRINEIETIFQPKTLSKETLTTMISKKAELELIFSKIDSLEMMITEMKNNVEILDEQVKKAEIELNIPSNPIRIFDKLNSILKPTSDLQSNTVKNLNSKTTYECPEICKTEKYFE